MSGRGDPYDFKRALQQVSLRDVLLRLGLSVLLLTPVVAYLGVRNLMVQASARAKPGYVVWSEADVNPQTSVVVRWETTTATGSAVWIAPSPAGVFQLNYSATEAVRFHAARLEGLEPGTRYYYRVGAPEDALGDLADASGAPRSFQTAPRAATPFNFTMISDTQAMWGTGHMPRVARALGNLGDTGFVANLGDLVQDGDVQAYWDYYFQVNEPWLHKFGFVPVTGNHDARGGWQDRSLYADYFSFATPGQRLFYAFNWSNALFVVMEIAEGDDENLTADATQEAWLRHTLAAAQDQAFRVVVFHRQVYSVEPGQDSIDAIRTVVPLLVEYNVSAVVHGHHHCYMRFLDPHGLTYLCLGGGGGMQDIAHVSHPYCQRFCNVPNYLVGHVDGDILRFDVHEPAGTIIDSVTLVNDPVTGQASQRAEEGA